MLIMSVFIMVANSSFSQPHSKSGNWHVSAAAGLLNGNTRTGASVTGKIERVIKDRWTVGLGSGFDHYYFRSVPVFAEIQRYVGKEDKGLYIYGAAGVNIPWPTEDQRWYRQGGFWWGSSQIPSTFSSSYWTDLGIGYGFKGKRGHGMFLRAGHSLKSMGQQYTEQVWNGTGSVSADRDISYLFGRVNIQVGFRF
jgi:hypothetical protein